MPGEKLPSAKKTNDEVVGSGWRPLPLTIGAAFACRIGSFSYFLVTRRPPSPSQVPPSEPEEAPTPPCPGLFLFACLRVSLN